MHVREAYRFGSSENFCVYARARVPDLENLRLRGLSV